MIDAGIQIIQFREKNKKSGVMYRECLEIRKMTRDAGVILIVNDHVDLAMICEADGVHVGQEDISIEAIRQLTQKLM